MLDRKRGARIAIRVLALLVVCALAADLAYKLVRDSSRSSVGRALAAKRDPLLPAFRLPVIWSETQTWPRPLRRAVVGGIVSNTDLRGYPIVINFFASWCAPCRQEASLLARAANRRRARVVILGVDVNDSTHDAVGFLRAHHTPYAAVRSSSSGLEAFGLVGLPETFYVDRTGRIRDYTRGQLTPAAFRRGIELATAAPLPGGSG